MEMVEKRWKTLLTDKDTFKSSDGSTPFPVDLGASWIHGITDNPLTALSREAGIDLFTSIEEVKMLGANMKEVDHTTDQKMGDLFDALLDKGVSDDIFLRFDTLYFSPFGLD